MNDKPIISIIIPVYNTECYLERCIDSVLRQSYPHLEIIVVNDASPGPVEKIVRKIQSRDPRVRYLAHEKNQGLFRARVTGMASATGEYFAFLDSDDYVSLDFYRALLNRAMQTQAQIVIGKTVWECAGKRNVYNLHDNCFQFDILEGEDVRNTYYAQEASCYSWHTVWNKLYHRTLIEQCFDVFDQLREHIIMTEDICFSSVFFYEAQRVARIQEEAYFYCIHSDASTDTSRISIEKFQKNVADIRRVFETVEQFLERKGADTQLRAHFGNARLHYGRMWQHLLNTNFTDRERAQGQQALNQLCQVPVLDHIRDDFFFESISTPWNGALEYYKERIFTGSESYISFDIFDTLIYRPFYRPEELLELLNPKFRELTGSPVLFREIRVGAERAARAEHSRHHPEHQDVTLSEIYERVSSVYGISREIAAAMMAEEIRLELEFSEPRRAGISLYEMAQYSGKKILIVSDMYLEMDTIIRILEKNGIAGYDKLYLSSAERKLKYTGDLFRCVLRDYPDAENNTLHIGDTWNSDVEGSEKAGFSNVFLPKSRELFENKIGGYQTNDCAYPEKRICGSFMDQEKLRKNLGIRTMLAVVYERYFDRPYRPFLPESNFNADPWFIGYYLLGMHLMGLCRWIDQQVGDSGRKVHFLSRDGYLPMKAYKLYRRYLGRREDGISYLQTSRKSLLPLIAKDQVSFYQLPVEFRAHTPMTLLEMVAFASKPVDAAQKRALLRSCNIDPDAFIPDEEMFKRTIRCFLEHLYSEEQHRSGCEAIRAYFHRIAPGDVLFDMGYSGRIQAAICDACGQSVDALFVHEDYMRSVQMKDYGGFRIHSFYDFHPMVSGLFREHLLSDWGGSCIGYRMENGQAVPVIEECRKYITDIHVVEQIHKGALTFMEDYLSRFAEYAEHLDFSGIEASMPLEAFMRHPTARDLQIFGCSYFEDEVYGGKSELNIEAFLTDQTLRFDHQTVQSPVFQPGELYQPKKIWEQRLMDVLQPKSKLVRALVWLLIDAGTFRDRLIFNLKKLIHKS